MESYTVTKEQLLTLVKMKKEQVDEDIRLRVAKKDIKDFVVNGDKYSWYELVPEFLPEKPKRYIVSAEQFEAILYSEKEKFDSKANQIDE